MDLEESDVACFVGVLVDRRPDGSIQLLQEGHPTLTLSSGSFPIFKQTPAQTSLMQFPSVLVQPGFARRHKLLVPWLIGILWMQ